MLFRSKGQTRESEAKALTENAKWMFAKANNDVNTKYIPKINKALARGEVSTKDATELVYGIAKQESKRNYFGGLLRFSEGQRIFTPFEAQLLKGIDLNTDTGKLKAAIQERLEAQSDPQNIILAKIAEGRK